ncbi:MAG: DUF362 domain-containing protein [Planctomycetes bacterium]|nr:DUF362 domain-containing protein [Planctomycetota bacterium]
MAHGARSTTRRTFLRSTIAAGIGGLALPRAVRLLAAEGVAAAGPKTRVAVTKGEDHADNIHQALKRIEPEIRRALAGKKRVLIKPNFVSIDVQLAATHADSIRGILAFLEEVRPGEVLVAESSATGTAEEGYANFRYHDLGKDYDVRFLNLDREAFETVWVTDGKFHPKPVRCSKLLLDPEVFRISAAVMKTHDRVIATLSLKNMVVGAAIKDPAFRWGRRGGWTDKPIVHGDGIPGINYNLFQLAPPLHPDLSVIDGYEGLEGNGPIGGTAVPHRIAIASTDWLAADRCGIEAMGIDYAKVGYLNYCAKAGMGQADLGRIEVLGPALAEVKRTYRLHDGVEKQYTWM